MRTLKESSIVIEKAIKKINRLTTAVFNEEKLEVIHNVCDEYGLNANHIINILNLKKWQ